MKTIQIAKDLALPLDAVTQTLAAIGRKGAGKTYLATLIAEAMLDAGAQIVVLDPVGNWWGLRVAADGRSKGKDVFVLGGDRGDVEITPDAGARIARLVVEKGISAVIDISRFRIAERKRFAADFGEELFHLKKSARTPIHVFVEEAQLFAPQRSGPDEARMLGAFEAIVRLGRNYGIGATLVTQRPQSVNKEVLSQVECLCVLQVNGVHERKALTEWVQENGADRELVGELPGLARGEGFVWSPSWLRIFRRVTFGKKSTFDASATPEVGKAERVARISPVDLEELRADLREIVEAAAKDDPKALRRRVAELEALVAAAAKSRPALLQPPRVERVEVPALKPAEVKRLEDVARRFLVAGELASKLSAKVDEVLAGLAREAARPLPAGIPPTPHAARRLEAVRPAGSPGRVYPGTGAAWSPPLRSVPGRPGALVHGDAAPATASAELAKGAAKILAAAAQRPDGVTREALTVLAGYKKSSRDTYLKHLRAAGYTVERGDRVIATPAGVAALGADFEPLPTGPALISFWRSKLSGGELVIFDRLVEAYPRAFDRDELGELAGYRKSSRDTYLKRLRTRRLVEDDGDGLRAAAELFA